MFRQGHADSGVLDTDHATVSTDRIPMKLRALQPPDPETERNRAHGCGFGREPTEMNKHTTERYIDLYYRCKTLERRQEEKSR